MCLSPSENISLICLRYYYLSIQPVSWQSLAAILLAGGLVAAYVRWEKGNKREEIRKQKSRTIGIASLGGEFTLTDHTGKVKTNESFLGQWIIIYFGFTHCPDICPDELDKLTAAIKIVDDLKKVPYKLQPLFVSVDPERDTPKQMAEYIKDFHPRLIGLTGTKEQVDKVTKAYRVYYSFGPKDSDNDYIVDHSIIMYLIDPEGNFKEYYGQNRSAKEIAASAVNHMLKYKAVNG
ncbi:uncharacterized protein TRIADDRAFT_27323 [Trichoplax adhaerens]|uniref:Thioredoxin domain-containing protein n=1 Tax=Trichoplax adhaerens TaxID=10228 RepID=B3RZJ3_TRIAD|nr:hypothetical protein TRIADDRAFT_27323 [Trichoplax adhaerens]EDV23853.1 hypothetical protein TRIADDRAFT_27323 [Trichoplax adhaerens]|eukprot:XP_002113379.1 hypothetical protein TRIADDRAFT_27323 [Trichoplax adhaerens]